MAKQPSPNETFYLGSLFVISVFLFAMFIALPIVGNIGNSVTHQVIQEGQTTNTLNASNIAYIQGTATGYFDDTYDAVMATLYFLLILCSFISAGYEGANPAATLLLGLFFVILAELVSFGISNAAHNYITFAQNLNQAQHLGITTYIMEYLPIFNAILTIGYIVVVITKKEDTTGGVSFLRGNTVST